MTRFLLALACIPAFSQTPDACLNRDLCVSATVLSQATLKSLYGPLNKQYGAASVDICSQVGTALTVPLAKIRQQAPAAGVTILPSAIAQAVIANAQGSTKWAKAGRITFAILGGAAVASGVGGISPIFKAGLTVGAISGSQIWAGWWLPCPLRLRSATMRHRRCLSCYSSSREDARLQGFS